jgi:hypothetical protein
MKMSGRLPEAGTLTIQLLLADQTLKYLFVDDEGRCLEHKFESGRTGPPVRAPRPRPYIPPLVVVCCVVVVELAGGAVTAGEEVVLSSVVVVVDEEAGIELSLAHPARANNPAAARDERMSVFIFVGLGTAALLVLRGRRGGRLVYRRGRVGRRGHGGIARGGDLMNHDPRRGHAGAIT